MSWLGPGYAWFDTGTHDSLVDAAAFVRTVEQAQGLKLGCLEEIAFRRGLIDSAQLRALAQPLARTSYGRHLLAVAATDKPARSASALRRIA